METVIFIVIVAGVQYFGWIMARKCGAFDAVEHVRDERWEHLADKYNFHKEIV